MLPSWRRVALGRIDNPIENLSDWLPLNWIRVRPAQVGLRVGAGRSAQCAMRHALFPGAFEAPANLGLERDPLVRKKQPDWASRLRSASARHPQCLVARARRSMAAPCAFLCRLAASDRDQGSGRKIQRPAGPRMRGSAKARWGADESHSWEASRRAAAHAAVPQAFVNYVGPTNDNRFTPPAGRGVRHRRSSASLRTASRR